MKMNNLLCKTLTEMHKSKIGLHSKVTFVFNGCQVSRYKQGFQREFLRCKRFMKTFEIIENKLGLTLESSFNLDTPCCTL